MGGFVDARTLDSPASYRADVCIVGAGAAGITVARRLAGGGLTVLLVESGGLEYRQAIQDLYKGVNVGFPYFPLDSCRLRMFGGTTNHWAGQCRPLDRIDFERRDWLPHSGWPLTREELDPFYTQAHEICQLGPFSYGAAEWSDRTGTAACCLKDFRNRVFQQSPPTKFGEVYGPELAASERIRVLLHASLDRIALAADGRSVHELRFKTLGGNHISARARAYVLAAGGVENARLLLLSRDKHPDGVGNHYDLVGRFFMDHPISKGTAHLLFDNDFPLGFYETKVVRGVRVHGVLALADAPQHGNGLLNAAAGLRQKSDLAGAPVRSAYRYAKHIDKSDKPDEFIAGVAQLLFNDSSLWHLTYFAEQAPNPDSRITLSDERDALGQHRVNLDWRLNDIDRRNLAEFHRLLAADIGLSGMGRLRSLFDDADWRLEGKLTGSYHHIGTTRMHDSPRQGVVDRNCRMHGVENLYVAGSSVFPTSGYANPTLTVVALAVRLADHLLGRVG